MNYKTHKWKWLLGLGLAVALIIGGSWWHFAGEEGPDPFAALLTPPTRGNAEDARTLMASVPDRLASYRSVQANLRQRVNLMGCEMTGTGAYLQGDPTRHLTRLEFRLQFDEAVLSWKQVCDGRALWSSEKGIQGNTRISRVNLEDFLAAERKKAKKADDNFNPAAMGWGAGGLPQFMANLNNAFEFSRVDTGYLDNMPARIVYGTWRPQRLGKLFKEGAPAADKPLDPRIVPEHLPQIVVVTLGADDLFPYRIEFLRQAADGQLQPTVTMELFQVNYRAELSDAQFEFDPGEVEIRDGTQDFINSLQWTAGE